MTGRSKALLAIAVIVVVMVGSVGVIVVGTRFAARHVPADSILSVTVSGSLPERTNQDPFAEVFGSRELSQQDLRDALLRAAHDSRIKAVRIKISGLATSFATVQEIRGLLAGVHDAGKPTSAFLETAGEFAPGNLEYYLASGCDKVVLNPLGDVNLVGLAARVPFIRGTLDKLGIEPDFPGIGAYKTARFFYTEKSMTPEDREMTQWLVDSLQDQLVAGVAESRGLSEDTVRAMIAAGPQLGPEALKNKLVDELADWGTFSDETTKSASGTLSVVSLSRYLKGGGAFDSGTPIAVVVAEGTIVRGGSGYSPVPLFGGNMMGSDTIAKAFREARDSGAKAVIFRIDSPGGSAIASEIIRAEMARTAKKIPVVVSMGGVAASGGYWITCGAQRIVSDPATITASIGVFGGHLAMERFWNDKLGVSWGRVDGSPNAAIFGSLDPWTPEQREIVQRFLDRIYGSFLDRVSEARHLPRDQVDAIGRGRVFTGEQALEKKLVDELGGFVDAVAVARDLAGLPKDADVELMYFPKRPTVLERIMEAESARASLADAVDAVVTGGGGISTRSVWMPPIQVR